MCYGSFLCRVTYYWIIHGTVRSYSAPHTNMDYALFMTPPVAEADIAHIASDQESSRPSISQDILMLRVAVAFLGEKEQTNWWSSSFLSKSGETFLSPAFPKTAALARVNGASAAAQIVHDEHIGIGDVYHLFRLPENIEHEISQLLAKDGSVLEFITSTQTAKTGLQELSNGETTEGIGPLLIEHDSIDKTLIARMAAAYMEGFRSGTQVYPYLRGSV